MSEVNLLLKVPLEYHISAGCTVRQLDSGRVQYVLAPPNEGIIIKQKEKKISIDMWVGPEVNWHVLMIGKEMVSDGSDFNKPHCCWWETAAPLSPPTIYSNYHAVTDSYLSAQWKLIIAVFFCPMPSELLIATSTLIAIKHFWNLYLLTLCGDIHLTGN